MTRRGSRGPISGGVHSLPRPSRVLATAERAPEPREVPAPPDDLGPDGLGAWGVVMAHAPLLLPELDAVTVARFCRLVDERAQLAGELRRGVTLEEAIADPRGGVLATRVVLNPAIPALRAVDKALDSLSAQLGLAPTPRARLGLTLTSAEKQAAQASAIIDAKFAGGDDG